MRRWFAGLALLCSAQALAQFADDPGRAARLKAALPKLDSMYAALAEKEQLPGLVYGVVLDGKLVHTRALGLADVHNRTPVQGNTRFRIASMSKSFVAMAALKLRDEGKLALDAPLAQYVPEVQALRLPTSDAPALTVRHLMTMHTGLPEDNPWGDRQMTRSNDEIAQLVAGGLSFSTAPGTTFEYSNLGYILLGKVVSKVSGMRFQDYVLRHIAMPLGMKDTVWEYDGIPKGALALGYRWTGTAWEAEPILHDGDGAAMGGLITTADDFARYMGFLLDAWPARDGPDSGPLRRASLREMQMPHTFARAQFAGSNSRVTFYGYGLSWDRDAQGHVLVGHSGGLPGYGSQYRIAPEHGVGVFAFTNLRYGQVYQPTVDAVRTLIADARLPVRGAPPSAILLTRQRQVAELIQHWDDALGRRLAAENFFLDTSRSEWMAQSLPMLAKIGKVTGIGPLKAENQLRGTFVLNGEKGAIEVFFTLTPEREPLLQELKLKLK